MVIDRFEGEFAVIELEDKSLVNVPIKILPPDAKEGDIISITINKEATNKAEKEMTTRLKNLFVD